MYMTWVLVDYLVSLGATLFFGGGPFCVSDGGASILGMIYDVAVLDRPWGATKVGLLFDGEASYFLTDVEGNQFEGRAEGLSAFELRSLAFEGGSPELILDCVQLERAIASIRDRGVRLAALARVRYGFDEPMIEWLMMRLGESRPAYRLLERAVQLIVRHESGRSDASSAAGIRESRPVCWRCLQAEVSQAGEDCGEECVALRDTAARPKREDLNEWGLDKLVATQRKGVVPGSQWADRSEVPAGLDPYETVDPPY